jgi:RNA polymerase sigma-70 factor (ECF subfamily)
METAGSLLQTMVAAGPPAETVTAQREFRDLYQRHWEQVFAVAYRVTGNASDAEDVLQTVFLRLLANRTAVDDARSPESYLKRASVNASIDILRRRRARIEVDLNPDSPAPGSSPVDKERLRRAIAQLDAESAEMFTLCYVEGYTYDELAGLFQVERGTVASRLHRIRMDLRESLKR